MFLCCCLLVKWQLETPVWLDGIQPIGRKSKGSAVGFIGDVGGKKYVVKLGMDNTQGQKATASILTKSIPLRGVSTDAIKEYIATSTFECLSMGQFHVSK